MTKLPENGLVLIDKPKGLTSFGVVARIRRQLSEQIGKKAKVGHTGTLDPFATGLLVLVTGQACKQASQFLKLDKTYLAEIILGATTPTLDSEGRRQFGARFQPSRAQVEAVAASFRGQINQIPPQFSALKVGGRRAYDLARAGQTVALAARAVTISRLEVLEYDYPRLTVEATVSSGTYIRSLARDFGIKLGTGAYCDQLRRLRVGEYSVAEALGIHLG